MNSNSLLPLRLGLALSLGVALSACVQDGRMGVSAPGLDLSRPTFVTVRMPAGEVGAATDYGLAVGVTEVTQAQWRDVMGSSPSARGECDACPVEQVSWYDAATFLNALGEREGLPPCYELEACTEAPAFDADVHPSDWRCHAQGLSCGTVRARGPTCEGYRLPTLAEWRVFAPVAALENWRRGPDYAVMRRGSRVEVRYVATLRPNEHGLYDTLGNVGEWLDERGREPEGVHPSRSQVPSEAWFLSAGTSFWTVPRRLDASSLISDYGSWACHDRGLRVVRTVATPDAARAEPR